VCARNQFPRTFGYDTREGPQVYALVPPQPVEETEDLAAIEWPTYDIPAAQTVQATPSPSPPPSPPTPPAPVWPEGSWTLGFKKHATRMSGIGGRRAAQAMGAQTKAKVPKKRKAKEMEDEDEAEAEAEDEYEDEDEDEDEELVVDQGEEEEDEGEPATPYAYSLSQTIRQRC